MKPCQHEKMSCQIMINYYLIVSICILSHQLQKLNNENYANYECMIKTIEKDRFFDHVFLNIVLRTDNNCFQ